MDRLESRRGLAEALVSFPGRPAARVERGQRLGTADAAQGVAAYGNQLRAVRLRRRRGKLGRKEPTVTWNAREAGRQRAWRSSDRHASLSILTTDLIAALSGG